MLPIACRHKILLAVALNRFLTHVVRLTLSLTVVCMVKTHRYSKATNVTVFIENDDGSNHCHIPLSIFNATQTSRGNLEWNDRTQGVVLGSFFLGYSLTQVLGGCLAERWGARWPISVTVFLSGWLTLVLPLLASIGAPLVVASRILVGMCHGVAYSANFVLIENWFPKSERSFAASCIVAGADFGGAFVMLFSGMLCQNILPGGWQLIFYLAGIANILWSVQLVVVIFDKPQDHPGIKPDELEYIQSGTKLLKQPTKFAVPWKDILLSPSVWCILNASAFGLFAPRLLASDGPLYLDKALGISATDNGILNAARFLVQLICTLGAGILVDTIVKTFDPSMTVVRNICETIALSGIGIAMLLIAAAKCDANQAIVFMFLGAGLHGFIGAGHMAMIVDIAGPYAGVVSGMANTLTALASMMAPVVVGYYVNSDIHDIKLWQNLFFVTGGLCLMSNLLFCLRARADLAGFAKRTSDTKA